MADATNTVVSLAGDESSLPAVTRATYNRNLLERALPLLIHQQFGQTRELKRRQGQSMVFRRYESLSAATTPLQDGVTPNGTPISKTDVVATINFYGNYTVVTDKIDLTWFDDVIDEASNLMGENEGLSMDQVYRGPINAGTNFIRIQTSGVLSTSGARTTVLSVILKAALDRAIRTLDNQNVKTFTPRVYGSTRIASQPIDEAYWAIIHPDIIEDLMTYSRSGLTTGTDFTPVKNYANPTGVIRGEVGAYRKIRFVATTNAMKWTDAGGSVGATGLKSTTGSLIDVYSCLIVGRDAYGIVPIMTGNSRIIIHKAGSNSDPLNQRNTVAWKAGGVSVILNDAFMCRVECGVTA